ncbi:hypothetical protein TIFTF001_024727 [Ficus carica]|uniref:Uncharacterized protein n=1 Tax=Ficus carica TaxID=3494 RepID=A0AA88AQ99_FICCA|nr:hypothetical protein TIFTF001_024727 [Ficus carica]
MWDYTTYHFLVGIDDYYTYLHKEARHPNLTNDLVAEVASSVWCQVEATTKTSLEDDHSRGRGLGNGRLPQTMVQTEEFAVDELIWIYHYSEDLKFRYQPWRGIIYFARADPNITLLWKPKSLPSINAKKSRRSRSESGFTVVEKKERHERGGRGMLVAVLVEKECEK